MTAYKGWQIVQIILDFIIKHNIKLLLIVHSLTFHREGHDHNLGKNLVLPQSQLFHMGTTNHPIT